MVVQFTLTAEEEARYRMLLCELQLSDHSAHWTAGKLAKSIVMSVVDDDLDAHTLPDDEGEVVAVH
jgi:hypothetical protein